MVASEYDLDYVEPNGSNASLDVSLSNGKKLINRFSEMIKN